MAKIMNLVDPKVLERLTTTEPVNPLHRNISALDNDMKTVLQRSDLSDREKVQEYNQVLQRYLEYQDHYRFSSQHPMSDPPSQVAGIEEDILRTVPKTLRRKAEALLDRIKRHPDMTWNERGEFTYKGKTLSGTNVVDLINDAIRHRKTFQPHGWQDFARALRQSNVPQDLIGHRERWEWMHRQSASSDAFSTADENPAPPSLRSTMRSRSKRGSHIREAAPKKEVKWEHV